MNQRRTLLTSSATALSYGFAGSVAGGLSGLISPPAAAQGAAVSAASGWTREAYLKAMADSGRKIECSEAQFKAIQERRAEGLKRLENYLTEKFGQADSATMKAFSEVPREYYHYNHQERRSIQDSAWESNPKPWAIGYGSALSDYLGQGYMTQASKPKADDTVLEIGTGSGFQSSILGRICKKVYSIEIIEPLGKSVANMYKPLNYTNVETKVGDGFFGWPEVKEGFDIIIVTCAAQYVPPALFAQLKPGGRMLIPIGQPFKRGQFLYIYNKDKDGKVRSKKDVGVFFIPMTGAMMKQPRPEGSEQPK